MDGETGIAFVRWLLENPEKGALFLVGVTGAWRWIKEIRNTGAEENTQQSFVDLLMAENRQLRAELKELRAEIKHRDSVESPP